MCPYGFALVALPYRFLPRNPTEYICKYTRARTCAYMGAYILAYVIVTYEYRIAQTVVPAYSW